MSWSETYFIFGSTPQVNASLYTNGTATGVPVDGSAGVPVVYGTPFPAATKVVVATVLNDPTVNAWGPLSVTIANKTANGFTIFAEGGPAGQTVSIDWEAFGA